jgi:hypothetical protein
MSITYWIDIDAVHAQLLACPGSTAADLAFSLVAEAKRLRAQVDDYRMMIDEHQMDNQHAYEEGGHEERAAVVAWLRKEAVSHRRDGFPIAAYTMQERADAIERGKHRREDGT